jgi:hypothetical protein
MEKNVELEELVGRRRRVKKGVEEGGVRRGWRKGMEERPGRMVSRKGM